MKYLLTNEHIDSKKEVSYLFISAFSKESQKNIKRELVKEKKIPYGQDGCSRPPNFQDVLDAAENKI